MNPRIYEEYKAVYSIPIYRPGKRYQHILFYTRIGPNVISIIKDVIFRVSNLNGTHRIFGNRNFIPSWMWVWSLDERRIVSETCSLIPVNHNRCIDKNVYERFEYASSKVSTSFDRIEFTMTYKDYRDGSYVYTNKDLVKMYSQKRNRVDDSRLLLKHYIVSRIFEQCVKFDEHWYL